MTDEDRPQADKTERWRPPDRWEPPKREDPNERKDEPTKDSLPAVPPLGGPEVKPPSFPAPPSDPPRVEPIPSEAPRRDWLTPSKPVQSEQQASGSEAPARPSEESSDASTESDRKDDIPAIPDLSDPDTPPAPSWMTPKTDDTAVMPEIRPWQRIDPKTDDEPKTERSFAPPLEGTPSSSPMSKPPSTPPAPPSVAASGSTTTVDRPSETPAVPPLGGTPIPSAPPAGGTRTPTVPPVGGTGTPTVPPVGGTGTRPWETRQVPPATPSKPEPKPETAPAVREERRPVGEVRRLRRGRLAIRKFDPVSVFRFSMVFYFCTMLVMLLAAGLIYMALRAVGVVANIEQLVAELIRSDFQIAGFRLFIISFVAGSIWTVVASIVTTFAAFLYNLIADVVGGVEMIVVERDQ